MSRKDAQNRKFDFPSHRNQATGHSNQRSGPKPFENKQGATMAGCGPVQGTSKSDQELLNDLLSFLAKRMQDDTLNAKRRESIQLARNFVKEHGYLVEHYCIYAWAAHGIVKILTDDETNSLPKTAEHTPESYVLVSSLISDSSPPGASLMTLLTALLRSTCAVSVDVVS